MPSDLIPVFTVADREAAEAQIELNQKIIDYDMREYPVEVLVGKYLTGLETDENEFFIPDYQREHTWEEDRQSRFIESVLMGLPIPLLYLADVKGKEGRAEVVDGGQRLRTLANFQSNKLRLSGLTRLDTLNGFTFNDLPPIRQRRFNRTTLRMIELREDVGEEVRREIFSRINTGSLTLNDMEVRWGSADGPFLEFLRRLATQPLFHALAPLSDRAVKLREREEFVLRFFAYRKNYTRFDRSVVGFLNDYIEVTKAVFDAQMEAVMEKEWGNMLAFAQRHFPDGFSKGKGHVRTPRIRFEAISVGVALALHDQPSLVPASMKWLTSETFAAHMRSDASNSRPKVIARIEFVRDHLLGTQ